LDEGLVLICDCSYEHHSIEEPAILLGGAFVVDVVEKEEGGKRGAEGAEVVIAVDGESGSKRIVPSGSK
jgi:hypothetical protein